MNTDYSYTAIAAFVPDPCRSAIVAHSRTLNREHKSWFLLDEEQFPPHVTIWIAYVPTRNLDRMNSAAKNLLETVQGFEIRTGAVKIEHGGYVSVEVAVTEQLRSLHNALLTALNDYREGYLAQKYIDTMSTFSPAQQESLKQYGTRSAGKLFAPHITVGVAAAEAVPSVRQNLAPKLRELENCSFAVNQLVFFRQAQQGKSIEVLHRYELMAPAIKPRTPVSDRPT